MTEHVQLAGVLVKEHKVVDTTKLFDHRTTNSLFDHRTTSSVKTKNN